MADHYIKKPHGVVEDVLVKVNKFLFSTDFVKLDFEADKQCPIILGRPFLNTARALIDVYKGKLTLRVGSERIEFVMSNLIKYPIEVGICIRVEVINNGVKEASKKVMPSVVEYEGKQKNKAMQVKRKKRKRQK